LTIHIPECRNRQCTGCGPDAPLRKRINELESQVKELEHQLLFIGDKAVTDWDDETVGQVDAVVPKVPETYMEWARGVLGRDKKKNKRIEELEKLLGEKNESKD